MWVAIIEIIEALKPWKWFKKKSAKEVRALLVVEDSAPDWEIIEHHIYHLGHKCEFAKSAEEAYGKICQTHYEIVFLDIGLPYSSGWTLFDKITSEFPDMRAVITCGSEESLLACPEGVHIEFIRKNVTRPAIQRCLQLKLIK